MQPLQVALGGVVQCAHQHLSPCVLSLFPFVRTYAHAQVCPCSERR